MLQDKELDKALLLCRKVCSLLSNKPSEDKDKPFTLNRNHHGKFVRDIIQISQKEQLKQAAALNFACALDIKDEQCSCQGNDKMIAALQKLKYDLEIEPKDDNKFESIVQAFDQRVNSFTRKAIEEQQMHERTRLRSMMTIDLRAESPSMKRNSFNIDIERLNAPKAWDKMNYFANYQEDIKKDTWWLRRIRGLASIHELSNILERKKESKGEEKKVEKKNIKGKSYILSNAQITGRLPLRPDCGKLEMESASQYNIKDQNTISDILDEIEYEDFSQESLSYIQNRISELNQSLVERFALSGELTELEKIDAGKSGEVYRHFHTSLRKFLATKSLFLRENANMCFDKAMLQEIKNILKVRKGNSQNLLQIYRIEYQSGKSLTFLMEYGIGTLKDLFEFVENEKIVYQDLSIEINKAIHNQMDLLKEQRISYTDLHSGNILIREDNTFIFCDYEAALSVLNGANNDTSELAERLKSKSDEYLNIYEKISKESFFSKFKADRVWQIYQKIDSTQGKKSINMMFLDLGILKELKIRLGKELEELEEIEKNQKYSSLSELTEEQITRKLHCLGLLGNAYLKLGDFKGSQRFFEKAKSIGRCFISINPAVNMGTVMEFERLGNWYFSSYRYDYALEYYNEIENIIEDMLRFCCDNAEEAQIKNDKALILLKIGKCYSRLRKKQEAEESFIQCKNLYKSLNREDESLNIDFHLAVLEEDIDKMSLHIERCRSNNQLQKCADYYFELMTLYHHQGNQVKSEDSFNEYQNIFMTLLSQNQRL